AGGLAPRGCGRGRCGCGPGHGRRYGHIRGVRVDGRGLDPQPLEQLAHEGARIRGDGEVRLEVAAEDGRVDVDVDERPWRPDAVAPRRDLAELAADGECGVAGGGDVAGEGGRGVAE